MRVDRFERGGTMDKKTEDQTLISKPAIQESMNQGWMFRKIGDTRDEWEFAVGISCDEQGWVRVSLPHTWNQEDAVSGKSVEEGQSAYYRGKGVYRRWLMLDPAVWKDKTVFLTFEGANTITTVYVNGTEAGCHRGGYGAFCFDITKNIIWEEENLIVVVVSNEKTTWVAPLMEEGDFTKYGGIYRDVFLMGVNKIHFDRMQYGTDGVSLYSVLSEDLMAGNVDVDISLQNDGDITEVSVVSVLRDRDGAELVRNGVQKEVKAHGEIQANYSLCLENPHLWNGVNDPYLYTLETFLLIGNEVVESVAKEIGFRRYEVQADQFYLNGERYPVHGVNYHQENERNGWAMTDEERESDYALMREMGVTAVRMAHYQHDALEYQLCDRLGLLVYTEIPLINRSTCDSDSQDWTLFSGNIKSQLSELILQNLHHPSVCFWGISNELYDTGEETVSLYSELCALAKRLDGTRLTIYADNVAEEPHRNRSAAADLVGYNRYDGWYYTRLGDACNWVAEKQKWDRRPSCLSEYGAGGAVSQHRDLPDMSQIDPNGIRHYEEYQAIYHEEEWADIVCSGNLWGSFVWCMFDFASASRVEGDTRGQNDKGLVTRDRRTKKDAYYFYQSVWCEEPMVYITSSRYQNRPANVPQIKVYSNGQQVELFLNGQSVGYGNAEKKPGRETVFRWNDIELLSGTENQVKAVACFSDGSQKVQEICWKTREEK